MKTKRVLSSFLVLACLVSLIIPTFAATARASDQIRAYRMDTIVTEGAVNIEFSITGKIIMNKIGCESIYLYRKSGNAWVFVASKKEDDTGMSKTSKVAHGNTISFAGTAGTEYMVVVTVFAEDDAARDTRSQTFYVTGK